MRPRLDKPRIPARDSLKPYTEDPSRALKSPDETGKSIPEPEANSELEQAEMTKRANIEFQFLKAEETELRTRANVIAAVNREWGKHVEGTAQVGGTIILGDFRWERP